MAYSDASDSRYGGYVVELGPDVAHGQWSETESKQSSTWRELKAIYLVLKSYAKKLEGHIVKWLTDNQGTMCIVRAGTRKEHLQDGALVIFELCFTHSIRLEMDWIPSSLNEYVDAISRIIDYDDWMPPGAHTQWTVLLPHITNRSKGYIAASGHLAARQLTLSL